MIRVYGITNCDTVKKARRWLDAHGVAYEFIDFKRVPPERAQLERWCAAAGVETLVNRRGTTWRQLDAATQARASTLAGAVQVLLEHPSAIKRPVLESGTELLVGFDAAQYARLAG